MAAVAVNVKGIGTAAAPPDAIAHDRHPRDRVVELLAEVQIAPPHTRLLPTQIGEITQELNRAVLGDQGLHLRHHGGIVRFVDDSAEPVSQDRAFAAVEFLQHGFPFQPLARTSDEPLVRTELHAR